MTTGVDIRIFVVLTVFTWNINAFLLNGDHPKGPIKVAAFNIQQFGSTKMSDPKVSHTIVQILSRYDVVLVQEVRDSSHATLDKLLARLQITEPSWAYTSSAPLGSNIHYQEQYVFFYRTSSIALMASHQVSDPQQIYEREPFAVKVKYFSTSRSENRQVVLAGIHTKPTNAVKELEELDDTIKNLSKVWSDVDGVITMGDFNADCTYLTKTHRDSLTIFLTTSGFQSLIPDTADTTVKETDCAYDRIVLYGAQLDVRDAGVYNFMTDLSLDQDFAEDVSDHFPIEFNLY